MLQAGSLRSPGKENGARFRERRSKYSAENEKLLLLRFFIFFGRLLRLLGG